jgi:hypothetical protein
MGKVASKVEHFDLERKTVAARDFRPLVSHIKNLTVQEALIIGGHILSQAEREHLVGL